MLIYSFLDAHHKACSPINIKSGCEVSGIYPLNPNHPLESQFTMPEIPANLKVRPEDEIISGKWSNSEEMLKELFLLQHGRSQNPNNKYDFFEIVEHIKNGDCEVIFFSQFPPILIETSPNKFKSINL